MILYMGVKEEPWSITSGIEEVEHCFSAVIVGDDLRWDH